MYGSVRRVSFIRRSDVAIIRDRWVGADPRRRRKFRSAHGLADSALCDVMGAKTDRRIRRGGDYSCDVSGAEKRLDGPSGSVRFVSPRGGGVFLLTPYTTLVNTTMWFHTPWWRYYANAKFQPHRLISPSFKCRPCKMSPGATTSTPSCPYWMGGLRRNNANVQMCKRDWSKSRHRAYNIMQMRSEVDSSSKIQLKYRPDSERYYHVVENARDCCYRDIRHVRSHEYIGRAHGTPSSSFQHRAKFIVEIPEQPHCCARDCCGGGGGSQPTGMTSGYSDMCIV